MALTRRKERRPRVFEIVAVAISASLLHTHRGAHCMGSTRRTTRRQRRGLVDSLPNADVRSAAAKISIHRRINVLIVRLGRFGEQRRGGHHLSRLAIAALRHVQIGPGELHRMRAVPRKPFDRSDLGVLRRGYRRLARPYRASADMHCASAALPDTATILRATKI